MPAGASGSILVEHLHFAYPDGFEALKGIDLSQARLVKAGLERADLDGANLEAADLSQAALRRSSLREAYLVGVNLTGANLENADLEGARLDRAREAGHTAGWRGGSSRPADPGSVARPKRIAGG